MDVFNAIIGIIGTILGGILSYAAFHSSSKKDNKNEGSLPRLRQTADHSVRNEQCAFSWYE